MIENHIDWDEHLHMVLYAYYTTFKVTIIHTLFQVVYGLYPLMPTKYLFPMTESSFLPTFWLVVGTIGTFEWKPLAGSQLETYKAMEHDIMGSTKPQN